jgi:hypothetical protein
LNSIPLIVATTFVALTWSRPAAAQAPEAWFGTWRLNVAKSVYNPGPPPYKRATYTIEPWQDGVQVTYDLVHPRGGVTHLEWSGRFDGKDYAVQGLDQYVTYAYRPVGDGLYEVVVKIDDRVTGLSTISLSTDGKTMTTTTRGKGARGQDVSTTTVYEKVP